MTTGPMHPPPPPPQHRPTGWIDLTIQGNVLISSLIVPRVLLNGHLVPTRYGQNVYPVPPGPWRIDLEARWLKKYGQASITVDVPEGQTIPVFYAAPLHQFARGNIGHTRQKVPGKGFLGVLGGMVAALLLLIVLVALLA